MLRESRSGSAGIACEKSRLLLLYTPYRRRESQEANVEINLLNEFVVFSKYLNYTAAAKELFIAQSTLSVHMYKLEESTHLDVINHTYPPSLTPAGNAFLRGAQAVLDAYNKMMRNAKDAAGREPLVRIYNPEQPNDAFFSMLNKATVKFVFASTSKSSDLFESLAEGSVDVGFVTDFRGDEEAMARARRLGIATRPVLKHRISFASMEGNPLRADEPLTRERLAGCLLELGEGAFFDQWKTTVVNALNADGADREYNFRLSSPNEYYNMRFADFSPMIQVCETDSLANALAGRNDVAIFDLVDGAPVEFDLLACYRENDDSPTLKRFLEDIASV